MNVDEFLEFLFPGVNGGDPTEAVCIAELVAGEAPHWDHTKWRPGKLTELRKHYFCISTVRGGVRDRKLRRRVQDLRRTWVIGLDDIGTARNSKVNPDALPIGARKPTIVMETSPNNHQYLYRLDPACDPGEAANLIKAIAAAGYTDKGATGANRVLRLPGSLNDKYDAPFHARALS
jgi:hypothetical protein